MTSQTDVFLRFREADNWYTRNKEALTRHNETGDEFPDVSHIFFTLRHFKDRLNSILEIGCSNGAKLERLCRIFNAKGHGIDPSQLAVADGNQRLAKEGQVDLVVGTANHLPFEDKKFDLVYFAFCLYVVDRQDLFAAAAEANRVLKESGFLVICDFDPTYRHKRDYHYKSGTFTYKQDYSRFFCESGLYNLVAKHSFSHDYLRQPFFEYDSNERISLSILVKEIEPYIVVRPGD